MIERGSHVLFSGFTTGVPGVLDESWMGMIDSKLLEYKYDEVFFLVKSISCKVES